MANKLPEVYTIKLTIKSELFEQVFYVSPEVATDLLLNPVRPKSFVAQDASGVTGMAQVESGDRITLGFDL